MYEGKILYSDFEPHHLKVLNTKARFKTIVWHRKSRKTTFAIKNLIREAFRTQGVYWIIEPFFNQGKRILFEDPEMLSRYLPNTCRSYDNEGKITFPNGSIIRMVGADTPESLRGPGLRGVVFDEFDDISVDVWNFVVRPMLSLTGGWAWFMGTFKGVGNLSVFHERGQSGEAGWWSDEILRADTSGLLPAEEVEALLNEVRTGNLPEIVWRQEYLCEKIQGGAGIFRRIKENVWDGNLNVREGRKYKIGVDLAKLSDFTVITPIDLHTWKVGMPDRFQQLDYPMIEARIENAWRKYNKAKLQVEANSIGEPVIDHLMHDKGITNIEGVTLTESSREAMLKNLSVLLETDQIKIPNNEQLIKELQAMRYERDNKTKKIKLVSAIHDDMVFSLAHTCWQLPKLPEPKYESVESRELREFLQKKKGQTNVMRRI